MLIVLHVQKDLEFQQNVNTAFRHDVHHIHRSLQLHSQSAKRAIEGGLDRAYDRLNIIVSSILISELLVRLR